MNQALPDSEVNLVLISSQWLFPGLPIWNVRNNYFPIKQTSRIWTMQICALILFPKAAPSPRLQECGRGCGVCGSPGPSTWPTRAWTVLLMKPDKWQRVGGDRGQGRGGCPLILSSRAHHQIGSSKLQPQLRGSLAASQASSVTSHLHGSLPPSGPMWHCHLLLFNQTFYRVCAAQVILCRRRLKTLRLQGDPTSPS